MRASHHLFAVEGFGREKRKNGVGGTIENGESIRVAGKLMSVDEAAVGLVEGVGRDAVVFVELFADGGREPSNEPVDLGLSRLVSCDSVGASEAGEILAKAVARDVAGHVFGRVEEG